MVGFCLQKGEALMKTRSTHSNIRPLFFVLMGLFLGIFFFLGVDDGSAQSGLYEAVVTCDEVGYSVTLFPDWGPTYYTYDYSNLPDSITRRVSAINMAPSTDPISSTWASIGGPTAYVNFAAHWVQQTRQLLPTPGSWVTEVNVYTNFHLVINQADCAAPPPPTTDCEKTNQYYMYTLVDANQPASWADFCYIISYDGHPPNVEAQARVCTPPGSEHTFRATNIPFGGWVSADCQGNASYGWPYWNPSWYRP
jgi:hypothetical protein